MPTNPPPSLLDRDLSKALIREDIEEATRLLQEVINHGVAAFARCSATAEGGHENLTILFPYFHLLEMIDGVQILLSDAAPIPARLQLRSAFEAVLTIEYITDKNIAKADAMRRAYAYLVADVHRRLATYRRLDPNTPQFKEALKRQKDDIYAKNLQIQAIPDLDAEINNLENLLKKPLWKEADAEYHAVKKQLERTPHWYQLYGGPKNLEGLATALKRGYQYDILYRTWSQTVHVEDIARQLTKGKKDKPAVRVLRDPSEFNTMVNISVALALMATRRILTHYRPEELRTFNLWYVKEVRKPWSRFNKTMASRI